MATYFAPFTWSPIYFYEALKSPTSVKARVTQKLKGA